jgi:hypothetical protein
MLIDARRIATNIGQAAGAAAQPVVLALNASFTEAAQRNSTSGLALASG